MTGYIYALWHKNENDIFYIGSSINPARRVKEHIAEGLFCYITDEYLPKYLTGPRYFIIDEIEFHKKSELLLWEIYWIDQFRQRGFQLKNQNFYHKFHFGLKDYLPKHGESLIKALKLITKRV